MFIRTIKMSEQISMISLLTIKYILIITLLTSYISNLHSIIPTISIPLYITSHLLLLLTFLKYTLVLIVPITLITLSRSHFIVARIRIMMFLDIQFHKLLMNLRETLFDQLLIYFRAINLALVLALLLTDNNILQTIQIAKKGVPTTLSVPCKIRVGLLM